MKRIEFTASEMKVINPSFGFNNDATNCPLADRKDVL